VSIPFSLRAELKGVEVAPGVTLRYWEAGAGRALAMCDIEWLWVSGQFVIPPR
jgi:hypothetical protein